MIDHGDPEKLRVFLHASEPITFRPYDKPIFKMGACDWFKPPKSTRLLASDSEKYLYLFECHSDMVKATWLLSIFL